MIIYVTREKKQEMRDADRGTQELAEGFAFTMLVKNSTNLLYKIVNEGMLTKKTPFNAFGESQFTMHVFSFMALEMLT